MLEYRADLQLPPVTDEIYDKLWRRMVLLINSPDTKENEILSRELYVCMGVLAVVNDNQPLTLGSVWEYLHFGYECRGTSITLEDFLPDLHQLLEFMQA
jgi:hypothetical protein